ncbi:PDZ domain-containing protein [Arenibacter sp. 6A1]|uniref:S41 family peptidase n=1 Tax=Arenibacter sp. 6A1 TaxID=2720391 RepID=UPI001444D1B9|nr:S41 family peptidase [Arenibacter sp. 6A1]NKI27265.1 PDZ domain-containing protein [Arenibacter sp. 6A1]
MNKYLLLVCFGATLFFTSCSKPDDTPVVIDKTPPTPETIDITVQNFMWQSMNAYYFWQADVPDLSDSRFSNDDAYIKYLESEKDPGTFFYNICNNHIQKVGEATAVDRFSFYTEDYKELTQSFSGISKSNGLEFGLSLYGDGDQVFGYVRYIVPNSNAATKDIKRGDIFTGVNGVPLNRDNYIDLLFGTNDTYTLNIGNINNRTVSNSDKEVTLTKEEGLIENPVFLTKVLEVSGQKIGYLMYNSFTNEFDKELNTAFDELKAAGITDLVLDLRYNPGGRVNSAVLLSSMIYGTYTDKPLLKARYNTKLQSQFKQEDLTSYFADTVDGTIPITTLNLNKVYVLATRSTASASELVMNGLEPYIEVVHIGTATTGKNEFSVTFVDDYDNGNVYDPEREDKINPKNSWAIQPLLGRNENADGFSDYTNGLLPDYELSEDLSNLGVLGSSDEPLLAKAISLITGSTAKKDFSVHLPVQLLTSSKMFTPVKDNMYMDFKNPLPLIKK